MIQDIGEHKFDLSFRQPEARDEDYVLYMKSNKTLLRKAEDGNYEIPRFSDFPMEKVRLKMKAYYLFAIDGTGYYYVREMLQGEEDGYEFCPTSVFRKMTPMYQAFAGITATQLYRWKESRRFCGCCGHALSRTMNKTSYYYCRHSEADEESRCHKMRLNAAELEQAVFLTLKKQMEATAPLAPDGTLRADTSVPERAEYEQQIEAMQDSKRTL